MPPWQFLYREFYGSSFKKQNLIVPDSWIVIGCVCAWLVLRLIELVLRIDCSASRGYFMLKLKARALFLDGLCYMCIFFPIVCFQCKIIVECLPGSIKQKSLKVVKECVCHIYCQDSSLGNPLSGFCGISIKYSFCIANKGWLDCKQAEHVPLLLPFPAQFDVPMLFGISTTEALHTAYWLWQRVMSGVGSQQQGCVRRQRGGGSSACWGSSALPLSSFPTRAGHVITHCAIHYRSLFFWQ